MVITKTPFRISFFGGGTDYPAWYMKNGPGAVISTTINKYCYISCRYLPQFFKYKHRIVYSKQEYVNNIEEITHPTVRESLKLVKPPEGVEIHYIGDLPARSGIGSSSSFAVGLLNALYSLCGETKTKHQLAQDAVHVEQNMVKSYVGSQDQVAAAFGGLNKIEFHKDKEINVMPIIINKERLENFQNHLMLFFTDFARDASKLAKGWIKNMPQNTNEMKTILSMVDEGVNILTKNSRDIDDFGKLLDESWKIKRSLTKNITSSRIDEIYQAGKRAGALGGKILGAGGGGFIIFFAKPEIQPKIKEKLKKFLHVPFRFEQSGTQVIYFGQHD